MWLNPPFFKISSVLTKLSMEPVVALLVTPSWETPSSRSWKPLLDQMTSWRLRLRPVDGSLFVSGHGEVLPSPSWPVDVTLIDSTTYRPKPAMLDECLVKWLSKTGRMWGPERLQQASTQNHAATTATTRETPTREQENPHIAPKGDQAPGKFPKLGCFVRTHR